MPTQDAETALARLAGMLMSAFAQALGLPEDYFAGRTGRAPNVMRANRYLRQPGLPDPAPGQLRMGAHTDYGACTILLADDMPGLEILGPDGAWHGVRPVPGAFIVNIGDLLARWTNDRWRSTLHRVVPPPGALPGGDGRRPPHGQAARPAHADPVRGDLDQHRPPRHLTAAPARGTGRRSPWRDERQRESPGAPGTPSATVRRGRPRPAVSAEALVRQGRRSPAGTTLGPRRVPGGGVACRVWHRYPLHPSSRPVSSEAIRPPVSAGAGNSPASSSPSPARSADAPGCAPAVPW